MTGEKKIVGLWRDSAAKPEAEDASDAARANLAAPEAAPEAEAAAPPERDWLDMSALAETEEPDFAGDSPARGMRDRLAPTALILCGIGWTGFALFAATQGFARPPVYTDWPALMATIAMPLTLLLILWMVWLRSRRSEQTRFARVADALREENRALHQSMRALADHLADAQRQLAEQARTVLITNRRGLHARASAKFVTLASAQPCEVRVAKDGSTVTGTSIMGLMMLGAAMGDTITISAAGDGAGETVEALVALVEAKFGED